MIALSIILYLFAGFFWALFAVAAASAVDGKPPANGWAALVQGAVWPISLTLVVCGILLGRFRP